MDGATGGQRVMDGAAWMGPRAAAGVGGGGGEVSESTSLCFAK